MSHPKLPQITKQDAERADAVSSKAFKARQAVPTWDDLKSELGAALVITDNPDGTRDGRVYDPTPDKKYLRRLHEMTRPSMNLHQSVGDDINARVPTATLRDRDGNERPVVAHNARKTALTQGLHEKPYYGRPTLIQRDGKWWRRVNGEWRVDS